MFLLPPLPICDVFFLRKLLPSFSFVLLRPRVALVMAIDYDDFFMSRCGTALTARTLYSARREWRSRITWGTATRMAGIGWWARAATR